MSAHLDLPYDDGSHPLRRLDLHLPDGPAGARVPLLLWFHGGGLESGDKSEQRQITFARRLNTLGIAVALANYRLSPGVNYPAYLNDAAQAAAWALSHACAHGCDASLHIGGESAGGYLAAMLALDSRLLASAGVDETRIAGFIPMSGQLMTHFTIRKERGTWNGVAIDADEAAPIHHLRADTRPILLLVADRDMPTRLEETRYFHAALTELAGNRHTRFHVIPDRDHCSIFDRCLEPFDPCGPLLLDFIFHR